MKKSDYIQITHTESLSGTTNVYGAKNAVLVSMASLLLVEGVSRLSHVPCSHDVLQMIELLEVLGAHVHFDTTEQMLTVDTRSVNKWHVPREIMQKMRASILVMGPLISRFGHADIALPGGCVIGARPIDFHLKSFARLGVTIHANDVSVKASAGTMRATRIVLEYPSVGATENIMLATLRLRGRTTIVNAALEPEVMDLVALLRKMGAQIDVIAPATIIIEGVTALQPIEHAVMPDRLEVGALLAAAAITHGSITIPNARAYDLDVFLHKLEEMGHRITIGDGGNGITFVAIDEPRAVSFKTGPYPGFPTDLQAPMMALQAVARGTSIIEETVFENRLLHVRELQKMGALIQVEGNRARVTGVDELYGTQVIATDIRASCALVLAGMRAQGDTYMTGVHHWQRGYDALDVKLTNLGARISMHYSTIPSFTSVTTHTHESDHVSS